MTSLAWLVTPLAGCLVAVLILGYLGLHVLRREVIFVDLALAQIAALGATYAFYLGFAPESIAAAVASLLFCLLGATLFAVTRSQEGRLPQEAIIGICYVVAAATAVLLVDLAEDPHGAERIRFLLVGSIVWATWAEIGIAAAVCGAVGVVHVVFRRQFGLASWSPQELVDRGQSVVLWDLLFYATFGLAITAIVPIVGVLLVFSYLIIPGAVASLFFESTRGRLVATWTLGLAVSFVGLLFGYERPPGPFIVACFGVVLAVALVGRAILDADRRWSRALQLVGGLALLTILLAALPRLAGPGTEAHEDGHAHEADVAHAEATLEVAADPLASPDPLVRQEAIDRLVVEVSDGSTRALLAHLPVEEDDELRLRVATALHVRGVTEGTVALGALAEGADIPFVRLTAQAELEGEPPVK